MNTITNGKFIENESFAKYTTLKIGGPVKVYSEVTNEQELINAIKFAKEKGLQYIVIGSGSNLLVSDDGFDGMVIRLTENGIVRNGNRVYVKAGTSLSELVEFTVNEGLSGFEKLIGIPGTVGGAIYGNAGAYGQTISDSLVRVKVLKGIEVVWMENADCEFSYRHSGFKDTKDIILEVEFLLQVGNSEELKKASSEILAIRLQKYPNGIACPGSFFKNVEAGKLSTGQLKNIPEDKIMFGKIPAGFLLEAVGAKGKSKGGIKIADYHANLLINTGGGTASDFIALANEYKNKVREKFGIELEPEVQLIGFEE